MSPSTMIGDVTKARTLLGKYGIKLPDTDAAIANLADFITQPGVTRNRVAPSHRGRQLRELQTIYLKKMVVENGTSKLGTIRHLLVRRAANYCWTPKPPYGPIFVAVVDWTMGGMHRGISLNRLTLVPE